MENYVFAVERAARQRLAVQWDYGGLCSPLCSQLGCWYGLRLALLPSQPWWSDWLSRLCLQYARRSDFKILSIFGTVSLLSCFFFGLYGRIYKSCSLAMSV